MEWYAQLSTYLVGTVQVPDQTLHDYCVQETVFVNVINIIYLKQLGQNGP